MSVRAFPNAPEFTGLNSPLGEEYELDHLPVEGRIPAEVAGTFSRAVPDPAFPPYLEDGAAVIAGDGMVSALRFAGGQVSFAIRYVQTERHQAEVAVGHALFGKADLPAGEAQRRHHAITGDDRSAVFQVRREGGIGTAPGPALRRECGPRRAGDRVRTSSPGASSGPGELQRRRKGAYAP